MVGRFLAKLGPKTYRVRLENTVPNEPGISPGVQLYLTPRRDQFLIGHPTRPKLKTQTASCEDDFAHTRYVSLSLSEGLPAQSRACRFPHF